MPLKQLRRNFGARSAPRNSVLQRFLKTGYYSDIPHAVSDVLRVKRTNKKPTSFWRQPKFLKGVGRDGNYYRLKIPPRRNPLPNIPKFPKGHQRTPPKPLTPPPAPPESAAEIIGYKRRLFKWFLRNAPVLVLNFGRYVVCTQRHHDRREEYDPVKSYCCNALREVALNLTLLTFFCTKPAGSDYLVCAR
jgi:hypothetical protein